MSANIEINIAGTAQLAQLNRQIREHNKALTDMINLHKELGNSGNKVIIIGNSMTKAQGELMIALQRTNRELLSQIKGNTEGIKVIREYAEATKSKTKALNDDQIANLRTQQAVKTLDNSIKEATTNSKKYAAAIKEQMQIKQRFESEAQSLIARSRSGREDISKAILGQELFSQKIGDKLGLEEINSKIRERKRLLQEDKGAIESNTHSWLAAMVAYRIASAVFHEIVSSINSAKDALIELDKQAARTTRVTGGSRNVAFQQIATLATKYGVPFSEAGEAQYQISTIFNQDTKAAAAATEASLKLVIGTESDMRETTRTLTQVYEQFGDQMDKTLDPATKLQRIAELMAVTWKLNHTEMNEMSQALKYFGPIAEAARVPLEQVFSLLGGLTAGGVRGRMSGTGASRLLENIMKGISGGTEGYGVITQGKKQYAFDVAYTTGPSGEKQVDLLRTIANIQARIINLSKTSLAQAFEYQKAITGSEGSTRTLGVITDEVWKKITETYIASTEALKGHSHVLDQIHDTMQKTFGQEIQRAWQGTYAFIASGLDELAKKLHVFDFVKGIGDKLGTVQAGNLTDAQLFEQLRQPGVDRLRAEQSVLSTAIAQVQARKERGLSRGKDWTRGVLVPEGYGMMDTDIIMPSMREYLLRTFGYGNISLEQMQAKQAQLRTSVEAAENAEAMTYRSPSTGLPGLAKIGPKASISQKPVVPMSPAAGLRQAAAEMKSRITREIQERRSSSTAIDAGMEGHLLDLARQVASYEQQADRVEGKGKVHTQRGESYVAQVQREIDSVNESIHNTNLQDRLNIRRTEYEYYKQELGLGDPRLGLYEADINRMEKEVDKNYRPGMEGPQVERQRQIRDYRMQQMGITRNPITGAYGLNWNLNWAMPYFDATKIMATPEENYVNRMLGGGVTQLGGLLGKRTDIQTSIGQLKLQKPYMELDAFNKNLDTLQKNLLQVNDEIAKLNSAEVMRIYNLKTEAQARKFQQEEFAFSLTEMPVSSFQSYEYAQARNRQLRALKQSQMDRMFWSPDRDKVRDEIRRLDFEYGYNRQERRLREREEFGQQVAGGVYGVYKGQTSIPRAIEQIGDSIVQKMIEKAIDNFINPQVIALKENTTAINTNTAAITGSTVNGISPPAMGTGSGGGTANIGTAAGAIFGGVAAAGTAGKGGGRGRRDILPGKSLQYIQQAMAGYSIYQNAASQGVNLGNIIGSGLTGFAMGGPIGAGIGVGLDLLGGIFGHKHSAPMNEANPAFFNAPSHLNYMAWRMRLNNQSPSPADMHMATGNNPIVIVNNYVDGVKQTVSNIDAAKARTAGMSAISNVLNLHTVR